MGDYFHRLVRGDERGPVPVLLRGGLWLLSIPYALATRGRNWLYDRGWKKITKAEVPVVSVGNLTVGGTGKTPCVEYVARFFRGLDLRVAILSRGYGSKGGPNDEALVLEENLPDVPHLQGADRVALAKVAVEELESELLVLDDGFQHRRLGRDLDIVLVDATQPWGHGAVLPRGLMREPRNGLRRAGAVLITRADLVPPERLEKLRDEVRRLTPTTPVAVSEHRPTGWRNAAGVRVPLEEFRGRPVGAFCGLGNPEAFRASLAKLGLDVVAWRTFPDHHAYSRDDIEELRRWARTLSTEAVLTTTQKDLVKIRVDRLGERGLWALVIELHVGEGREALEHKLKQVTVRGEQDA